MFPYLRIFDKTIPTYGVAAVVGCLLAALWVKRGLRSRPCCEEADAELGFLFGLIGTWLGAKVFYLLTQLPNVMRDIARMELEQFLETYFYAGFVFYGGLYGCLLAVWIYARTERVPFRALCRCLLPAAPLIHAFGRLGCFATGCCYGRPAKYAWSGIAFSRSEIAPNGVPLVPVQLWEAGIELLLFFGLSWHTRRSQNGILSLGAYLACYGAARFFLEFLRGDDYRGFLGPLSVSQAISVITVLAGVLLLLRERKRCPSAAKDAV